MHITLSAIRRHSPCEGGWKKLLAYLGKTKADSEPLSLLTILNSNGLDDALWCLSAVEGHDREMRLYAVWCARQVQHLMTDQRSLDALDVAERYALGEAIEGDLIAAQAAALTAAYESAQAATQAAAYESAQAATQAAARAAAYESAQAAAYTSERTSAQAAQAAAHASARAAAYKSARTSAQADQADRFREMFG